MNRERAAGGFLIHRVGTPLLCQGESGVIVVAGEWWNGGGWGGIGDAVAVVRLNGSVLPDGGEWVPVHVEQESTRAERLAEWEKNILK